ncbi:MAG TPA: hypothetical protein VJI96_04110 [Candidatus Andersenbacteria bacterium]|nr:hypothetical protein [Candidatus Andersenbacteria bacterium]
MLTDALRQKLKHLAIPGIALYFFLFLGGNFSAINPIIPIVSIGLILLGISFSSMRKSTKIILFIIALTIIALTWKTITYTDDRGSSNSSKNILKMAVADHDPSICKRLPKLYPNSSDFGFYSPRQFCYREYAEATSNAALCIQGGFHHDDEYCVRDIALQNNDPTACLQIEKITYTSSSEEINHQRTRAAIDSCMYSAALDWADIKTCEMISNSEQQKSCKAWITNKPAEILKAKELCNFQEVQRHKDYCLSQIEPFPRRTKK